MHYVYKILNEFGHVEYVGQSINPKERFRQHTRKKGAGHFYKRYNVSYEIIASFQTLSEALIYEKEMKAFYNLRDYETEGKSKGGQLVGYKRGKSNLTTTADFDLLVIQDLKSGMTQHAIAEKYGINRSIVRRIKRNNE